MWWVFICQNALVNIINTSGSKFVPYSRSFTIFYYGSSEIVKGSVLCQYSQNFSSVIYIFSSFLRFGFFRYKQGATWYNSVCFILLALFLNFKNIILSTLYIHVHVNLAVFAASKVIYKNNISSLRFLLLLLGDVSLKARDFQNHQQRDYNVRNIFITRRCIFIYSNIKRLLPKIEELTDTAKISNAVVIGIKESKLINSFLHSKIFINGYDVLRYDRNIYAGGITYYIRNDLSYDININFQLMLKMYCSKVLLPKLNLLLLG